MLLFILLYLVVAVVDQFLVAATVDIRELPLGHYIPMGMVDPNVGVLVLLYRPIMAIPTIAVTIRRLHDVGKSGWLCLLWGITHAGFGLALSRPDAVQAIP